jgi:hypothetical protein
VGLLNVMGGFSPVGVQMVLPATVYAGMICEIGKDCMLWVRGHESDLLSVLFGLRGRWFSADTGTITISEWNLKDEIFEGTFDAETGKGHISGKFRARPQTRDE